MYSDCSGGGEKHQHVGSTGFGSVLRPESQGVAVWSPTSLPLCCCGAAAPQHRNSDNSLHCSLATPQQPTGKEVNSVDPRDYGGLCFAHLPLAAPVSKPLCSPEHWVRGSVQALHTLGSFPRGKSRQLSHQR